MTKQKIEDKFLEDIAGGVISNGLFNIEFSDNMIVMKDEARGEHKSYTEDQFVSSLTSQGVPQQNVNELVRLIKSGSTYTPMEVRQMTGLSIRLGRK